MAKIHRTKNKLKIYSDRHLNIMIIAWFSYLMLIYLFLHGVVSFGLFSKSLETKYFVGIGFFISSVLTIFESRKYRITKIGIKGEKRALESISKLDDGYHVFTNLKIKYEDKESETDIIVIGKKGVFVIEVKNHNGKIVGEAEDKEWKQYKVGRKGGKYTATMYNPTKQVGTHVWRLSKVLKEKGIFTWVQGVVYFVNPQAEIQVKSENIPVLTLEDSFIDYIENFHPHKELEEEVVQSIVANLKAKS